MARESKRPHYATTDTALSSVKETTKRMKLLNSPPELSLATLSLHEVTHTSPSTVNDYNEINQYLRQIHIERFGDPELRERWWQRLSDPKEEHLRQPSIQQQQKQQE